MSITSFSFVIMIFLLIILYYLVPVKLQWIILLGFSLSIYIFWATYAVFFILITAFSTYLGSRIVANNLIKQQQYFAENKSVLTKEKKRELKERALRQRKLVLTTVLVLNLAILACFKYSHFIIDQVNPFLLLFGATPIFNEFEWIMPLGISFYTFQTIGYLVSVYWGNIPAERNFFKYLLFVSFFPQITQGPISEYKQLSHELFAPHSFSYANFAQGFQRMLLGYVKKMVLADLLSPYVQDVFRNYSSYAGITVFIGALAYSVQIYADFSGYMDIMCGICQMLGISLRENFDLPYFSKSVAEYWRRWHISLGDWFKRYVYYPIAMAKWNNRLAKSLQKRFGKNAGKNAAATVALIAVWFLTGLWHGASWAYIAWGGLNGVFLILSLWLEPFYKKSKALCRIQEDRPYWKKFQVLRTFLLITFIKVLPEVGSLSDGIGLWKQIFTNHRIPTSFPSLFPFVDNARDFAVVSVCTILLFISSLLKLKAPLSEWFNRMPYLLRIVILAIGFLAIALFGIPASRSGGFMYAGF